MKLFKKLFRYKGDKTYFLYAQMDATPEAIEGSYYVHISSGEVGIIEERLIKYFKSEAAATSWLYDYLDMKRIIYNHIPKTYRVKLGINLDNITAEKREAYDFNNEIPENLEGTGNGYFDDCDLLPETDNTYWVYLYVYNKELALNNIRHYYKNHFDKGDIFFTELKLEYRNLPEDESYHLIHQDSYIRDGVYNQWRNFLLVAELADIGFIIGIGSEDDTLEWANTFRIKPSENNLLKRDEVKERFKENSWYKIVNENVNSQYVSRNFGNEVVKYLTICLTRNFSALDYIKHRKSVL